MGRARSYYTLVASLPALPRRFDVDRLPVSRVRLEERLSLLEPEDAAEVDRMRGPLSWDRPRAGRSDEAVLREYESLRAALRNPLARELVAFRMDTSMILGGLRRRRRGAPRPPEAGPWAARMRSGWKRPDFGLGWRFPWIAAVDELLGAGRELDVHRLLLSDAWDHARRLAERYTFEFESVLLYLARWEIVASWVGLDAERGAQRFEKLMEEATVEHLDIFH